MLTKSTSDDEEINVDCCDSSDTVYKENSEIKELADFVALNLPCSFYQPGFTSCELGDTDWR